MHTAYKAFAEIDGKWELVAWAYTHSEFMKHLSEAVKIYPNVVTNIGA